MGKYTGKSDFFDWCNMHNKPEDVIKKATVFLSGAKITFEKPEDLIPYYTHTIASMSCSKEKQFINLSKESYLDTREKERLSNFIYNAIMWAQKAHREKKSFNLDFIKDQKNYKIYSSEDDYILSSIVNKIKKYPELIKFPIKCDSIIKEYILPHYFYDIHDKITTSLKEDFIKYAEENGFAIYKENSSTGEYHPIIWNMSLDVAQYYKKYGEAINE